MDGINRYMIREGDVRCAMWGTGVLEWMRGFECWSDISD